MKSDVNICIYGSTISSIIISILPRGQRFCHLSVLKTPSNAMLVMAGLLLKGKCMFRILVVTTN